MMIQLIKNLLKLVALLFIVTLALPYVRYVSKFDSTANRFAHHINPAVLTGLVALAAFILTGLWIRWIVRYKVGVAVVSAPFAFLGSALFVGYVVAGQPFTALFAMCLSFGPVIYFLSRSGTFRGWHGEYKVAKQLRLLATRHPGTYYAFNNILLQDSRHSSEIDHVVLSPFGIFVIETKSYKRVHITEDGRWFHGGKQGTAQEVRSPLKQNDGHIAALRALLGDTFYISMVALAGKKISGYKPLNVLRLGEIYPAITSYRYQQPLIEPSQLERMAETLNKANKTDSATRREHVRQAKARQSA